MERRRLFLAIDITDDLRAAIDHYINGMKLVRAAGVRWERAEKIHLTLKFFGDTDASKIAGLESALTEAAAQHWRFVLSAEGTGVFPTPQKARVLWIGLRPNETLSKLHADIDNDLEPLGFPKESRRFNPHLTIARIRDAREAKPVIDAHLNREFGPLGSPVRALTLYESKLLPGGSVYSPVKTFPLEKKS